MKNGEQVNFIMINKTADSLHSLIADGEYRNTSIGRDAWKSLLGSDGSLQLNCNREGFKAHTPFSGHPKARIGILGNEQNDCNSCDSRIGFGTTPDSNTCGNVAAWGADNGNKNIKAMGYIFVQSLHKNSFGKKKTKGKETLILHMDVDHPLRSSILQLQS